MGTSLDGQSYIAVEKQGHLQIYSKPQECAWNSWNYWEVVHGKGECKARGRRGGKLWQSVHSISMDFYAWSQSTSCSIKNVSFVFGSLEEQK